MGEGGEARTAASRLLDVLGAFGVEHPDLSLTEIARQARVPLPTAHRLAGALAEWGALDRGEDGRYRIGLRLWEVAAAFPHDLGLRAAAIPFLEDLYEATHENVQMAVRDGGEAVFTEWIAGRSAVGVRTRVGARWPLHATGVGLVLLAHAPADEQERYLAGPLAAFTPWTLTEPGTLRRVLAEVRRTGCAVSDRQITTDAVSVAAPVRDETGQVAAAVSVVVPADTAAVTALVPAVRLAALGITRRLSPPR
ncbi:IclR family transcriptional regulator [Actinocorallia herbida]|uniref:IclR family transcriptional regulator n=1 Tax=Actinocorallia herbida TaxID=58109 RepID=A0A3N1CZT5_9ACTN|nr:IclR family transcriptional regulator [Actinocorallia herbida]ROO86762.1 IclR family transcriptional regulator [Actinocorallia herbida]